MLSGVSGLVEQLLFLLREQGATHVGLRHRPGDPLVPQRAVRGLQDRGRHAARAARPVPDRRAGHRGPGARAVADGRVRGRRRDRRRRRAIRRGPAGRAGRRLHPRQGHGAAGRRRADRALGPAARPDLRRRGRAREMGRAARERAGPTGPRGRRGRRLPGASRLGRQVGVRGAGQVRPLRVDPGQRQRLGRDRAPEPGRARDHPARPHGRGAALPRPGAAPDDGRRRRDPPGATSTSSSGTARTARAGRRSATSGASTRLRGRPHRWA